MIHLTRCWTGRYWFNLGKGWLAIGFGPDAPVERVYWRKRLVYAWRRKWVKNP